MTRQWFMDDEFDTPLPEALSAECARVYGRGPVGVGFAQGLAAFLAIPQSHAVMVDAMGVANSERLRDIVRMFHDPDTCRSPAVPCTVCDALS